MRRTEYVEPGEIRMFGPPELEMEFVYVPEGTFLSGTLKNPRTTDAFWIGKYEVTIEQYAFFVRAQPHWVKGTPSTGEAAVEYLKDWTGVEPPAGDPRLPVTYVSWFAAMAFCRWCQLRMPRLDEWEKAARGTDGLLFPWGNEWDADRCQDEGPVDGCPDGASPWGVCDMLGNVGEWTSTSPPGEPMVRYIKGNKDLWESETAEAHRVSPYWGFRCAIDA
jgi:formylglycine-generating enzyme required for sulfatase activity